MPAINIENIVAGQHFYECERGQNIHWIAERDAFVLNGIIQVQAVRQDTAESKMLMQSICAIDTGYALKLFDEPQYIQEKAK
jgi:hypothetical protein